MKLRWRRFNSHKLIVLRVFGAIVMNDTEKLRHVFEFFIRFYVDVAVFWIFTSFVRFQPEFDRLLLLIIKGQRKRSDWYLDWIALWVQQDSLSWIVPVLDVHLNEKAAGKTRANQLLRLIDKYALSHQPDLERYLCNSVEVFVEHN